MICRYISDYRSGWRIIEIRIMKNFHFVLYVVIAKMILYNVGLNWTNKECYYEYM